MKVYVTGVCGQLGHDVMNELARRGHEGIGSDLAPIYGGAQDESAVCTMPYERLDITDAEAVRENLLRARPDTVIHCAAWTAVDAAEEAENQEKVHAINASGTRHIAEVCQDLGCKLMYISTDYVFDGQGESPWQPDCENYAPLNVYGQTKLEGELAVRELVEKFFIVRIAWVFGINGKNFIKTMLRLGKERGAVSVVDDQIGSPTYTYDLAKLLVEMIQTDRYGRYHATNEGLCSWYEFACEIFKQAGMDVKVSPVDSSSFPAKAKRPSNSRMSKEKLTENGFDRLPSWQDALGRYLKELKKEGQEI